MDEIQHSLTAMTGDRSTGRSAAQGSRTVSIESGTVLTIGREGLVQLGADPVDNGLSRIALKVAAADDGWQIEVPNRRGAHLHPWAQAQMWAPSGFSTTIAWPRVAVRLIGSLEQMEYWVLLSSNAFGLDPIGMSLPASTATATYVPRRPRPLTDKELEAVRAVFAEHLAWPPLALPTTRSLEAAGARLGIHPSGVRERLRPVAERAKDLGLSQPFGVTDPTYVFHLAVHGYLPDGQTLN